MFRLHDPLSAPTASDRWRLLRTESSRLSGLVMCLDRTPRYHNRLDALQLAALIIHPRAQKTRHA